MAVDSFKCFSRHGLSFPQIKTAPCSPGWWLGWLERLPVHHKRAGSGQGTCPGFLLDPCLAHMQEAANRCASFTSMLFSHPPPLSSFLFLISVFKNFYPQILSGALFSVRDVTYRRTLALPTHQAVSHSMSGVMVPCPPPRPPPLLLLFYFICLLFFFSPQRRRQRAIWKSQICVTVAFPSGLFSAQ